MAGAGESQAPAQSGASASAPASASAAVSAPVPPPADDVPWVEAFRDGNIVAYKRLPPGAVAAVVRVQAQVPDLQPPQLLAVAWDVRSQAAWAPRIKRLDVLSQTATEVVLYEQIDVPVVRDRDFVLRLSLPSPSPGPSTELRIEARAALDRPMPLHPDHVRMTDLWSTWRFRPRPEGGTVVIYEAYGDPAGALPGWLKKSAAVRGPVDFVRALLQETRRRTAPAQPQ